MSRLDAKVAEENRQEFNKAASKKDHEQKVSIWLQANPQIGSLNSGKYYKIIDGNSISVSEFGQ